MKNHPFLFYLTEISDKIKIVWVKVKNMTFKEKINNNQLFGHSNIAFFPINNCIVNRKSGTNGKISLLNFINFIKTRRKY